MAANSKIEWTMTTWNPVVGCTMVSPGCAHCYAETMAVRLAAMALADIAAGRNPGRKRHYIEAIKNGRWSGKLIPVPEALKDPLGWKKPRTAFVNSMSDLFHESVPSWFIDQVFAVMAMCPQHTFQVLTKRAGRMSEYMANLLAVADEHAPRTVDKRFTPAQVLNLRMLAGSKAPGGLFGRAFSADWPLPNVWLGVSGERQKEINERHGYLPPAAVAFWSLEPLLGPINCHEAWANSRMPDWVIVGGESGPDARPMHPAWVRDIRDQCQAAGVNFFFKQWGAWEPLAESPGKGIAAMSGKGDRFRFVNLDGTSGTSGDPGFAVMARVGKAAAGRELDGREWDEMPEVHHAKA